MDLCGMSCLYTKSFLLLFKHSHRKTWPAEYKHNGLTPFLMTAMKGCLKVQVRLTTSQVTFDDLDVKASPNPIKSWSIKLSKSSPKHFKLSFYHGSWVRRIISGSIWDWLEIWDLRSAKMLPSQPGLPEWVLFCKESASSLKASQVNLIQV